MIKSSWILMSALLSFSAFAGVSFEEKKNRIEYLEELAGKSVSMDIEAYRRELEYDKQNLPLDKRAENEANLLAEQIKIQVQKAYDAALADKSPDEALAEVKTAIEKDLLLVSPELQDVIREVALRALDNAQNGSFNAEADLNSIQKVMLKNVEERFQFLNQEAEPVSLLPSMMPNIPSQQQDHYPVGNKSQDAERKEYVNKDQLLESLVSDHENTRWVSTAHMSMRSEESKRYAGRIGLQIKAEFLGVAISAGPVINFRKEYSTFVSFMAEGLNPVLLDDGNFDFMKRDRNGQVVYKKGKPQRRFIIFTCDASLNFSTEYSGEGGFTFAGVGASGSVAKSYRNSVSMQSRRVIVPDYIDNKTVTYKYLNDLCHMDFLNARVTNNMKVSDSLNVMMKNVVSSLRFSHPKNRCAIDSHCYNWYNKELIGLVKIKNFPRCIEEKREKYRACELRGVVGQNCPVYENGKRTSSGSFEFICDIGLRCQKYQDKGWLSPSKGKCVPINPRTYVDPFVLARRAAGN